MSANLRNRRVYQAGGTLAAIEAIAWPTSPSAAVGGALREAYAAHAAGAAYDTTGGKWARYEAQRADYEGIIARATPESDMVELAAATVGLDVVQRALKRLEPYLAIQQQNVHNSKAELHKLEQRLARLRGWWEQGGLTTEQVDELRAKGEHPPTFEELRAEIRALIGV